MHIYLYSYMLSRKIVQNTNKYIKKLLRLLDVGRSKIHPFFCLQFSEIMV